MSNSLALSVISGLAVGAAFIFAFTFLYQPHKDTSAPVEKTLLPAGEMINPSRDSIKLGANDPDTNLISASANLTEVKAFLLRYPDSNVSIDRSGDRPIITYNYEHIYVNGSINDAQLHIALNSATGQFPKVKFYLDCAHYYNLTGSGAMSESLGGTSVIETINTMKCAK